jgi:organic solute transporter subunit alpha
MAVVHVIIFLALNLITIESPETLDKVMLFFVPFIAATIILGVWAFQITIRTIVPYYADLKLLKKFFSFQLVLIVCKLQPVLMNLVLKQVIVDCDEPLTIVVKIRSENAIYVGDFSQTNFVFFFAAITQTIIEGEIFLLSLWAHSLYKT